MEAADRIICAVDVRNVESAVGLVTQLRGHVGVFKVGLELLMNAGIQVIPALKASGADRIFVDAKLHDIPNTVIGAMRGIARLGAWCVTVHATGGTSMLRAAVQTASQEAEAIGGKRPLVFAVTVLTSIDSKMLGKDLHVAATLSEYVAQLACMAYSAGCDGVIASPHEIEVVRQAVSDPAFLIVTPGVRPAGSDPGDQARVMTPAEAVQRGADYLVIGRPITGAPDPGVAASAIAAEIASAG